MTTDYDPIAEQYKRSKLQPWRGYIEAHTLMELAGDLNGKAVVDIACGEGFYTRLIRQQGAARVVGVDLSEGMVALARKQETENPLGIEYMVGDGRALDFHEEFDLATAAYLLNYATDRQELSAMCRGIGRCLKPGGRFVTVNMNQAFDFESAPSYRQYGFETRQLGALREGTPVEWKFHLDDGAFTIENYLLDVSIHEEAFQAAGFREVRWHLPRLSPHANSAAEPGFWDRFLQHPPVIFIECVK